MYLIESTLNTSLNGEKTTSKSIFISRAFAAFTRKNFTSGWFETAQGGGLDLIPLWRQKQKAHKNSQKKKINGKGYLLKKIAIGLPGVQRKCKKLQECDPTFLMIASRSFAERIYNDHQTFTYINLDKKKSWYFAF